MKFSFQHVFPNTLRFGKNMFFLYFLLTSIVLEAQPFIRDTTFQPVFSVQYIFNNTVTSGNLHEIIEHPIDSTIFMVGSAGFYTSTRSGSTHPYNPGIPRINGSPSGFNRISFINDSILFVARSSSYFMTDTNGTMINTGDWGTWNTMHRNTVSCLHRYYPYFFQNGSSLMANRSQGIAWYSCNIFNPPDTFPHRHIVKVDSLGYWDSSFVSGADAEAQGFAEYDSNRIWVFGNPRDFTHYDGVPVNGLCRIYHDGRLDTTFTSPLQPFASSSIEPPSKGDTNGKFFIYGTYFLKDSAQVRSSLVRCNADGSLDTTFLNGGPKDSLGILGVVFSVAPTPDGGFLVGGSFNKYQSISVNSIIKIDSIGRLQPQYFPSRGPDSSTHFSGTGIFHGVRQILPSKFGGYYVIGDWQKWDGQPSQPIVRLIDSNTLVGLAKQKPESAFFNFTIFPNPATEAIVLQIEQPSAVQQIELYDLMGRQQLSKPGVTTKSTYRISVADLPKGIYLVALRLENGRTVTKKLLIK